MHLRGPFFDVAYFAGRAISIGVLYLWDNVPHRVDRFGVGALGDLALLAEVEIIHS